MKKLTLDIDALRVESFDPTASEAPPRGTVEGHLVADSGYEIWTPCCHTNNFNSCYNTCQASCYGTCNNQATCYWTCKSTCICPSHHATECNCGSADWTACCI